MEDIQIILGVPWTFRKEFYILQEGELTGFWSLLIIKDSGIYWTVNVGWKV